MIERPTSITIISWILIIMGGVSLVSTSTQINNPQVLELMSKSPIPIPLQYTMTYAGLIVLIISGAAMLWGHNWARLLYAIWSAIGLVIGLATSPVKMIMIPSVIVYLIIISFLFRRVANEFFSPRKVPTNAQLV